MKLVYQRVVGKTNHNELLLTPFGALLNSLYERLVASILSVPSPPARRLVRWALRSHPVVDFLTDCQWW